MSVSVKQLANELTKRGVYKVSDEALLEQFRQAGIDMASVDSVVTDDQKSQLLKYLQGMHHTKPVVPQAKTLSLKLGGAKATPAATTIAAAEGDSARKTIRMKRTTQSTLKGTTGQKVKVVVRKEKTYEQRPAAKAVEQPVAPKVDEIPAPEETPRTDELVLTYARNKTEKQAPADEETPIAAFSEVATAAHKVDHKKVKIVKGKPGDIEEEVESKEKAKAKRKDDVKKGKKKVTTHKLLAEIEEIEEEEDINIIDDIADADDANTTLALKPKAKARKKHKFAKPTEPMVHEVKIPEHITVSELAKRMSVKGSEVVRSLFKLGTVVTINQMIDQDTAVFVVEEMGHTPVTLKAATVEDMLITEREEGTHEVTRAPVVTIMGHVDHGKTSLLDTIRLSKITAKEAGGITQHIGAYQVPSNKGMITFIDTPGHEAFTAMRARGAKSTDIVVLVVAADDGVMPQTVEAIQHARAAEVPIVVAVNKMDKPEADPERIRNELSKYNVISEAWGGDTMFVPISAKTGQGVDELLDSIITQAEVLELKAKVDASPKGVVLESRLDKGVGPIATVLIQNGTLKQGDIVLCGATYGRVRAMRNDLGKKISEAGPSTPVEILGLSELPQAGDDLFIVSDERKAREIAIYRHAKDREIKLAKHQAVSLENLFQSAKQGKIQQLNIVLKGDVQGSVEALTDALARLSTDEVQVKFVSAGVGGIAESDVNLALASNAIIIGFNVRADVGAKQLIEKEQVDLHYYSIIYDAVDQIKQALSGLLAPEEKENIIGLAEVRDVFRSPKFGAIAGCMVIDGNIKRSLKIRVLRDNVVILEGELESLRRYKDDVSEVRQGMECGIGVKNFSDFKANDQIEAYEIIKVKRSL